MKVASQNAPVGGVDTANSAAHSAKAGKAQAGHAPAAGKQANTTTGTGEKVNLSQRVMDMSRIKELAKPNDTVNEARVAELQKMIDAGEYKTDAEAIANRLVDEHLNMPS